MPPRTAFFLIHKPSAYLYKQAYLRQSLRLPSYHQSIRTFTSANTAKMPQIAQEYHQGWKGRLEGVWGRHRSREIKIIALISSSLYSSIIPNCSLIKPTSMAAGLDLRTIPLLKSSTKPLKLRLGTVPNMSTADTKKAIDSAYAAFKTWSKTTAKHRQDLLTKLFITLQENAEDLATLITAENGKSFYGSKGRSSIQQWIHRMVCSRGDPYVWKANPSCNAKCSKCSG